MGVDYSFNRLQRLTGSAAIAKLHSTRVIVFGVGGVGSWCVEALIRSGIGYLTIVDSDRICRTNVNRQLQATRSSVGKVKVEHLAERLRDINPKADITPRQEIYNRETAGRFDLQSYDYVIDAIDSLSAKVELIINATAAGTKVFSALGASGRLDPTAIRITPLWESKGCRLGRFVRKRLRRRGFGGNPLCVYSEELLPVLQEGDSDDSGCGSGDGICPKSVHGSDSEELKAHEWCGSKKRINGSAVHITGTYGFFLAGLVVQDVVEQTGDEPE
jgi:tRNA threonylcarbamoyladenosine dehydratase